MDPLERPSKLRRIIIDDDEPQKQELKEMETKSNISIVRGYYTEYSKYAGMPEATFNADRCEIVTSVDGILIYRDGKYFHAVNSADNRLIAKSIQFDYLHEVLFNTTNILLLLYLKLSINYCYALDA
jgi:hypothetical protein